jgi:ribonucleoside-diphosphate reductase alpha chain
MAILQNTKLFRGGIKMIYIDKKKREEKENEEKNKEMLYSGMVECPECGNIMYPEGGCWFCPVCGYSPCK